jgi:Peptidase inhibitor family I36
MSYLFVILRILVAKERTMRTKLSQRLFAIALVGSTLGLIGLDVRAAQAQEAQACVAFEDANYGGAGRGLRANENTPMTTMNDKISSFKIRSGCHVEVYQDRDFKGASTSWSQDVAFVGNNWNDRISSWKCVGQVQRLLDIFAGATSFESCVLRPTWASYS